MAVIHELAVLLEDAAIGRFPPSDGKVDVLAAPPGKAMSVSAFSAHFVIATSAPERWVREQLPTGDLEAPMSPRFLAALGQILQRRDDGIDMVFAAAGLPGCTELAKITDDSSARVVRANTHRDQVRTYTDPSGAALIILGRGLAGRLEVAVEVDERARRRGLATHALLEARRLAGPTQSLFAQAAPGNAASVRAVLAAGFRPIGAEVLFFSNRPSLE